MKRTASVFFLLLLGQIAAQAFYNPTTGRWLSRDPIDEGDAANLYLFAKNKPVSLVDKDGRMSFGDTCIPSARIAILDAISQACTKILVGKFKCCMGSGIGADNYSALRGFCWQQMLHPYSDNRKVECESAASSPHGACAWTSSKETTIYIYGGFYKDGCGWGKKCAIGHELLHLVVGGLPHPGSDMQFKQLHKCLDCPPYPAPE